MRSDDLVPLLSKSKDKSAGFAQGEVIAWNPDTAANVILIRGTLFDDLPILNTSEASLLEPGAIVSVITWGSSYAILGRMVYPNTPEAVSSIQSITNRIQAAEDFDGGTRNSTTWGDLTGAAIGPSVTIRIGSSGRAQCFWTAEIGQADNYQIKNTPHVGVEVSQGGSVIYDPVDGYALNVNLELTNGTAAAFWIQAGTQHIFSGIPAGLTTFTMKYRHDGMNPAGPSTFRTREIVVFAL
jgi:hypothetical protein